MTCDPGPPAVITMMQKFEACQVQIDMYVYHS